MKAMNRNLSFLSLSSSMSAGIETQRYKIGRAKGEGSAKYD
jgi:hypothetical protein